ncbi:MAG: YfhO family protein [Candidatus Obscuribacterales bacterium]|nr:YfhO family protein [Candidatus Obscuribacterales bacterium]
MSRYHFTSVFAAGLLATLIIFYFPWLCGAQSFYVTDITNHFEPTMRILSEYWRNGQFQLWNPYAHCGEPQIAIPQPNLFYAPNWIFAWLPFSPALAANLITHQFLAGMGNFLLVASLGWGFLPAATAGVIAALSAYMFSLSTNYTLMASAAWLPLTIWSIRSMKTQVKNYIYMVIATLSMAMMILTGRPEIFAPAFVLIAGYIGLSYLRDLKSYTANLCNSVWQVVAIALAVLLALPFILPTLEWQALSPRAHGLVAKEVLVWSANWYDFLSILLPQPLGDLLVHPDKFLNIAAARPGYPPYLLAFVGPAVFALALIGIFDMSFSAGIVMSLLMIAFVVFAAGDNLPVAPYFLSQFPKLAILRYPVKLLFFPVWFISIFAARGFYLVMQNRVGKRCLALNSGLWLVLALIGLGLPLYQNSVGIALAQSGSAAYFKAGQLIGHSLALMAAFAMVVLMMVHLKQKEKISQKLFSVIVLGSIYCLLLIHAYSYTYHFAQKDFFDDKPTYLERKLASLHEDVSKLTDGQLRFVTLYFSGLLMPNKLLAGGDPFWPASYYQYGRQILTPSTHFDRKFCSSFGYEGAETADYRKLFVESFNKSHLAAGVNAQGDVDKPFYRFCQITSTKYVFGMIDRLVHGQFVESAKLDPRYFQLLDEDRTWNIRTYKVTDPLPRVYMSYNWKKLDANNQVYAFVNSDVEDIDPESITLVNSDSPMPHTGGLGAWQCEFIENSACVVRIKITTSKPGLLVLTDHNYPGWNALVDGKGASIVLVNGVLRGIFLNAGEHIIDFRYSPQTLLYGCFLSAIAALALLGSIVYLFFTRRA